MMRINTSVNPRIVERGAARSVGSPLFGIRVLLVVTGVLLWAAANTPPAFGLSTPGETDVNDGAPPHNNSASRAVTIDPQGEVTINADTNAATGTGEFTELTTNPVISEGAAGDLTTLSSITITPPADFDFDPSQTISAVIAGGDATFDLGADPGQPAIAGETSGSSKSSTQIQFTVAAESTTNAVSITFTGIQLRPLNCDGADAGAPAPTVKINAATLANGDLIEITIIPGVVANFLVEGLNSPQLVGDPINMQLTARDGCDNPIPFFDPSADIQITSSDNAVEYSNPSGGFTLTDNENGTATLDASGGQTFDANGQFTFDVTRGAVSTATITATGENAATGSTDVQWAADTTLASFLVEALNLPQAAGEDVLMRITARDVGDNPIADFDPTDNIEITSGGNPNVTYGNPSDGFTLQNNGGGAATIFAAGANTFDGNGQVTFTVNNPVAEVVTITADGENGSTGNTDATWSAGGLGDFLVESNSPQPAGQEIQVTLTARDANDNPIPNFDPTVHVQIAADVLGVRYSNPTGGFTLTDFGDGTARLDASGPETFDPNGQLTFSAIDNEAEAATITVTGENEATGNTAVTWGAAGLDKFLVESGAAQPAGQAIEITLTAADEFDNPIPAFVPAADIAIITDNANVTYPAPPLGLTPDPAGNGNATIANGTAFDANGQFKFDVSDTEVETVTLTADDGTATGEGTATWTSGQLNNFLVEALNSPQPTANEIDMRITARDVDDNPIANFLPSSNIELTTTTVDPVNAGSNVSYSNPTGGFTIDDHGDGTATVVIGAATRFNGDGQFRFVVINDYPETSTITADGENNATGNADATWNFGPLNGFLVEALNAPQQAGTAINMRLTALDAGGNPIPAFEPGTDIQISAGTDGDGTSLTYSNASGGFTLNDNGDGTATLRAEAGSAFDADGQFTFDLTNTLAETSTVSAEGENDATGDTDAEWTVGPFDNFLVEATNSPKVAGKPIKIRITAHDAWNNPIPDFDPAADIALTSSSANVDFSNVFPTAFTLDGPDSTVTIDASGAAQFSGTGVLTVDVTNTVAETSAIGAGDGTASGEADATWMPGPADHLAFTTQPTDMPIGTPLTPVVTIQDQFNNPVTGDDRAITLAIQDDPSGGTATLNGVSAPVMMTIDGVATWTDASGLTIDVAGEDYTLTASHLGPDFATADTVESAPFDITLPPDGPPPAYELSNATVRVTIRGVDETTEATLETDEDGNTVVTIGSKSAPDLIFKVDGDVPEIDMTTNAAGDWTIVITNSDGTVVTLLLSGFPKGCTVHVTTNEDGTVLVSLVDASGKSIGVTLVASTAAGATTVSIAYDSAKGNAARLTSGFSGLEKGESYGGSVTIAAIGLAPGSVISVALNYSDEDVISSVLMNGADEADLRLCKFNTETGRFESAGTNDTGVAAPTGVLGDFGVDTAANSAWAEVDSLGTFTVGIPEVLLEPYLYLDPLMSLFFRFPICGIGWAVCMCGTIVGLFGMKRGTRRGQSRCRGRR